MPPVPTAPPAATTARIEPITGRYVHLELGGRPHRVYFEEAGSEDGIPLVCLHTAGADGRQYRHLMTDPAVAALGGEGGGDGDDGGDGGGGAYRVLAFDMPRHGKSFPPAGWRDEEYLLTAEAYAEMVLAFCDGLALERPVVMGCSIGGRMALYLAIHHPERFRAIVGLEAADFQPRGWYDLDWLHQPDVHGGEACAAIVSGLVAPQSPDEYRWETLWQYMQGGPGVFRGDLWFYRVDGDLREQVHRADLGKCPLYLLTGEYDFSCTPEDSRRTAARIEGAQVTVMEALGHFPMSENPEQFRRYILPVLDEIAARGP